MLEYHETTDDEKYLICNWKYDGDYAIYNNPPYEEQLKMHRGFANPKNKFYSYTDGKDLIGYINLIEEDTEVFFGIGVNPAFCNKGYGQIISKQARELLWQPLPSRPSLSPRSSSSSAVATASSRAARGRLTRSCWWISTRTCQTTIASSSLHTTYPTRMWPKSRLNSLTDNCTPNFMQGP